MRKGVLYFFGVAICYMSCQGPEGIIGPSGLNSLIRTTNEPVGTNCQYGGLKIDYGLDANADGVLGDDEVSNTEYVCSMPGTSGKNSLINVVDVPSGADCANGGMRIDTGLDDNENGVLDTEEIEVTRFLCTTANGNGFQEQIRLSFGENYIVTTGTSWVFRGDETEHLINFNKGDYPGADSIVVSISLSTGNVNSRCFGELYNFTDGVSIANTQLESTVYGEAYRQYVHSGNIIDDLPDHQVSLGLRVRSEIDGSVASGGYPTYLFIYRNTTP